MNDWHYLNEVRPQELQRARQQTVPVQYESRYGAVSHSSDGQTWHTNNGLSREESDAYALSVCRERTGLNCQIIHRYANTCLALVRNSNTTMSYFGSDPSKWKAKRIAMKACKAEANNPSACQHYSLDCSLPVRIN